MIMFRWENQLLSSALWEIWSGHLLRAKEEFEQLHIEIYYNRKFMQKRLGY